MRYARFLFPVFFAVYAHTAQSFSLRTASPLPRQGTLLQANSQDASGRRRKFLNAMRRVFIGGTGAALWNQRVSRAFADDTPVAGKIVDLQIANLDGEVGKTGTIRIQLKPEWAPRGVTRFEVGAKHKLYS
jgi:hypothetical protein